MEREPKTFRALFNDDMARAIVSGRKTVTRRPVVWYDNSIHAKYDESNAVRPCTPGDTLIGRECTRVCTDGVGNDWTEYRADGEEPRVDRLYVSRWKPSIHMPDWAARIRRRVVSVTVERLQDIDEDEAAREGFSAQVTPRMTGMPDLPGEGEPCDCGDVDCPLSARMEFACAWISIYAAKGLGWDVNPWVWRIEFASKNVPAA